MGLASMEPLESPYSRYLIAALEHYLPNNPTPQVMDNLGKMGFYALRKEIAGFKDFPKVAEWLTKLAGPWRKLDLN